MDQIHFKINGKPFSVGGDVDSKMTLLEFLRNRANLRGTKYMCLEAGCGVCIVSVVKNGASAPESVNSCMVTILSCHNWDITTIEKVGNRLDGYHPIQKVLARHNGTQCGYCSPGWVMSMYSLMESKPGRTMLEIEKSFGSNFCRCTGYRPILEAFKTFATDAPIPQDINDIEDLRLCKNKGTNCNRVCGKNDWCVVSHDDVHEMGVQEIHLEDDRLWYRVNYIRDIFEILKEQGDDSYMLVAGNTAKGAYPIDYYPRVLIDISNVSELKGYAIDQNLVIGAGTTLTELLKIFDELSHQEYFGYLKTLRDHVELVAHIPVRNIGTIAGNLMIKNQHNEFQSDIYLLFETVGAYLTIMTKLGPQIISMQQFLKFNMRRKVIFNVLLPPLTDEYKIVTYKIMPRAQNAHAIVHAGFLYKYDDSKQIVKEARIVYGGLSASFIRAESTERFLRRKVLFLNETLQSAVGILEREMRVEEMPAEPSAAYRKQLALALFYKGLLSLCPESTVNPRFRSGVIRLRESRPVSQARQLYNTDPTQYPLTQPIPKIEALIQCAGEAQYTEDHATYPHEVYASLVLSTVATGNIVAIDPSRALAQHGAIAFYSAKDIPGLNSFTPAEDPFGKTNEEVFSSGEILYFNQPIGVVVAEKKHIANEIAKLVDVKYKNVKEPVIDVNIAKNDSKRVNLYREIDRTTDKGNDVEKVIKANHTVRGQYHMMMENIVCITAPTEEGFAVHTSTQWMDGVQSMIARALDIDQNRVDVHVRRLGGAFGIKISRNTLTAVACSLASFKLNRPCRLIMPLTWMTRAFGKRFPCSTDYEIAVDSRGSIQYLNMEEYEDHGFMVNEQLTIYSVSSYPNCYDVSRWQFKNFDTLTDTAKNSWFRAPGHLETIAVVELMMENISYVTSLDPFEVRLANLDKQFTDDILDITNTVKKNGEYDKRKKATLKFNAENRWKKRGLRVSVLRWPHEFNRYFDVNLSVLHGDGTVIITHGGIEMGQGINTKAVQICSYLLEIPLDKIQIKPNNTIIAPNASVSGGSLTTQSIIIGVQKCCVELLKRLQPIRRQMPSSTWEQLIQKSFEMNVDLQVHEFVNKDDELKYNIYGIALAEVEVDILTGESEILRVDIVQDVGHSVSPEIDIGQIEGAFVMGVGYWLTERLQYNQDTGELQTDRTWDYHIPQARDIPQDFRVYFRKNSYSSLVIFGAKAVGEPPICVATAVPFAIREAITSARLDTGIPSTTWFEIDGPHTTENVCLAAATKTSDFKFY